MSTPQEHTLIAKTLLGLEEVLADEIRDLGGQEIKVLNRAVSFRGDTELLYRCNLYLRTALKVLLHLEDFRVRGERDLYNGVKRMDWSALLDKNGTLAVEAVGKAPGLIHTHYNALRVKDAIVDYFRDKTGVRPSVDTQDPDLRIHLHLFGDQASVSLDSSGEVLSHRGYQVRGHKAPINEALAAGMILLSGWDKKTPFLDPMCGSGTIPLEAASMAMGIPANLHRNKFSFMNWRSFDSSIWQQLRREARSKKPLDAPAIYGSDVSSQAVAQAKEHLRNSNLPPQAVRFEVGDFTERSVPELPLFLLMNPPYGERIGPEQLTDLYKTVGDTLKQNYSGSEAWIISSSVKALKQIGLRASKKIRLLNGALECSFRQFELYQGTKKVKGSQEEGA